MKLSRGSIVVWGCFAALGTGCLVIIDRTIDFGQHLPILPDAVKVTVLDFSLKLENLSKEYGLNMFYSKKKWIITQKRAYVNILSCNCTKCLDTGCLPITTYCISPQFVTVKHIIAVFAYHPGTGDQGLLYYTWPNTMILCFNLKISQRILYYKNNVEKHQTLFIISEHFTYTVDSNSTFDQLAWNIRNFPQYVTFPWKHIYM